MRLKRAGGQGSHMIVLIVGNLGSDWIPPVLTYTAHLPNCLQRQTGIKTKQKQQQQTLLFLQVLVHNLLKDQRIDLKLLCF